jgi:hypothetical protein
MTKHKNVLFKPHISVKGGNLNMGIRTDIKLGGLHIKSSESTSIGQGGYKHKESSSEGMNGVYSSSRSNAETLNFNRHSTSHSESNAINGFTRSSYAEAKTSTWTGVKESKSREQDIGGFYDLKASQTKEMGLNGYKNDWSTHDRIGGLSTDRSHSVGVSSHGVQFTDRVGVQTGNTPLVNVTAPAVLLGATNFKIEPSSHTSRRSYNDHHTHPGYSNFDVVSPLHHDSEFSTDNSTKIDDSTSSSCFPCRYFCSFFSRTRTSEHLVKERNTNIFHF